MIWQQKHHEKAKEHLSSLNTTFAVWDKAVNELDVRGESLRQETLYVNE